jgi:hypothetical protein
LKSLQPARQLILVVQRSRRDGDMLYIWRSAVARFDPTDEEHVRRVRLAVAVYDRWRRPLLALYTGLAIGFVGLLVAAGALLQGLMQWGNMQGLAPGFLIGLALGAMLRGLAVKIGHGLMTWLLPPRTERLLLRYYDALIELAQESAAVSDSVESRAEPAPTAARPRD